MRTKTWAKNDGDDKPILSGEEYWEAWIDFENNRSRGEAHDAKTGERKMVAVNADGRMGFFGDNVETPEDPNDVVFNESYAEGRVAEGELWAYYYLRTSLPEGEVVGEVVRDGDTYWDISWANVKDAGGLALSGRALLRKPDYRPALVERQYPGGVHEVWTVDEWDVVDASSLPSSTFDPQSLRQEGCATQIAWYMYDLKERVEHPVYWAGQKVGLAEIIGTWRNPKDPSTLEPLFIVSDTVADPIDLVVGRSVRSWYMRDETTVTVATAPGERGKGLRERLEEMATGPLTEQPTAIGTATVATLRSGDVLAAVPAGDAVVLVQSREPKLLDAALSALRKLE